MSPRLYILGLGFSGLEIARQAKRRGWSVTGSVRSAEKAALLKSQGIDAEVQSATSAALFAATHILATAPPDDAGDPVVAIVRAHRPQWIGYLSTTGVYGDRGGDWVDETTPTQPGQPRSQRRVVAEQQWQALGRERGVPVHVFRLPAIYGAGRSALDQVKAGRAQRIDKPGQVFCRIHVEDIAQTVLAAIERPAALPGAIYNVCDDEPAPQADVIALACTLLDRPVPPLVPYDEAAATMSEMARSFYSDNRRVRNDRIKRELGVVLKYPTYREGLKAALAASGGNGNG